MRFVKLFQSLWSGSLRGMGTVQHVFIYLLGNADENGVADIHPSRISDDTGLSSQEVSEAIVELESEDQESRTSDHGGRRIERISDERMWGWIIVNYLKYRQMEDKDVRREQTAERMRRLRERRKKVTQCDSSDGSVTKSDVIKKEKEKENITTLVNGVVDLEEVDPNTITAEQAFDEFFWPLYPRKVGKNPAKKAWKALKIKDTDDALLERIMASLRNCVNEEWKTRNLDMIPHPSTWIRERRWED